jgi:hypothetical protein
MSNLKNDYTKEERRAVYLYLRGIPSNRFLRAKRAWQYMNDLADGGYLNKAFPKILK